MKYDIESIEKRKKNEKIFRNILKIILIILLYNIILLVISTIDNNEGSGFCGFKSYIITTSSMEPDIKTGDVVICQKTDAKDLKEALKLDENSVVLVISTEGDTDPVRYREIVWDGLYGTNESLSE